MKSKVLSAFRERGLHLAERDAEPQVWSMKRKLERKTDTMKTYILREPKAVQPQKSARPSRAKPGGEPAAVAPSRPALFIGLDVHNDSIAVSLAPSASTEVRREWTHVSQH
jgi:hypothetical protein